MRSASVASRLSIAWLAVAVAMPADTGVLIPGDRQQPNPAVFSLDEMALEILIDNGIARVRVRQIFGNHSAAIQEEIGRAHV